MLYDVEEKIGIEDNIIFYDPTSVDFTKFKWDNGYQTHIVTKDEYEKFYKISNLYYGSYRYEYYILVLNKISDVWDELNVGDKIFIPDKDELDQFIRDETK